MLSFSVAQAGIGAILIGAAGIALAASPAITEAVAKRQANYKEIGGAFKAINDQIKSGATNANAIRPLAKDLAARSAATLKYFPRGSGPESGLKTRAKTDIWANRADFFAIQKKMIAAANQLNFAAAAGDMARLATARNTLGGTCKTCHERFRVSE